MAEGTKLADAYVQIIPVSEGIAGRIKELFKDLPDEGDEAGEKTGKSLGNSIKNALIATGLTTAIGTIIKSSFAEGAALEQSLGGVETLFKEHADIVKKNAKEAYRTAGMSANEYMENVTGFSASLLSSLSGDTKEAAKIADMAMIDMSDNANKFGSDMQSIQYAYQGFAKQNYTMLDNLKLGYGGTKSEMERLLADAEKLSGHKYDISNLSDVYNAIHDIQVNLDVAGTTSKEAASTFSGSFSSMKAAAKNLLGDMSTGAGDVDKDIKEVAKTAKTFIFDNALPMLDKITDSLGPIKPLLGGIATGLIAVSAANKLSEITGGAKTLSEVFTLINDKLSLAIYNFETMETTSSAAIGGLLAVVTAAGLFIKDVIDDGTEAMEVASDSYDLLSDKQKNLIDNTDELAIRIANNSESRKKDLESIVTQSGAYEDMCDRLYELSESEKLTNAEKAEMSSLVEALNEGLPDLNLTLDEQTGLLNKQSVEVKELINNYEKQAQAAAAQENLTELYKNLYSATKQSTEAEKERNDALKIKTDLEDTILKKQKRLKELQSMGAEDIDTNAIYQLEGELQLLDIELQAQEDRLGVIDANFASSRSLVRDVEGEISGVKDVIADMNAETGTATQIFGDFNEKLIPVGERFDALKGGIEEFAQKAQNWNQTAYGTSDETLGKVEDVAQAYKDAYDAQYDAVYGSLDLFSKFSGGTAISAEDMISNLESNKEGVEEWSDNLKVLAERGVSGGLIKELKEAGPSSASKVKAMTEMTDDQLDKYSDLWDETTKSCRDIVNEQMSGMYYDTAYQVSKMIGIPYGEKESMKNAFELLGEYGAQGFADGLASQSWLVHEAAANIGNLAKQAASSVLQIRSPSRVFKEIGAYTAEGFALGIDSKAKTAKKASEDMVRSAIRSANNVDDKIAISAVRQQATARALPDTSNTGMRSAIINALAEYNSVGSGRGAKQPLVVYNMLDGHVISKAVVEDINNTTKLNGKSPLI